MGSIFFWKSIPTLILITNKKELQYLRHYTPLLKINLSNLRLLGQKSLLVHKLWIKNHQVWFIKIRMLIYISFDPILSLLPSD